MSSITGQENPGIFSQKEQLNLIPSQSLFSSPKQKKNEDFFLTYENLYNKTSDKKENNNNPYERLKIIEEIINNKNDELNNISNKLEKIDKIHKNIQKPLTYSKKQEIIEDNKIKEILNLKNASLGKKLLQISEKVKKIEAALLYGGGGSNQIPIKEKLKDMKNKKEYILLKMKENDNEIKKIEHKEEKNTYKEKQKNFLENLMKTKEEKNSKKLLIKKSLLLLTDNNINANEAFNKCLQEEELQNRLKEQKIKEQKYKELREKELEKVKERKQIINIKNERYNNNNWIDAYTNNKNYLSWDEKEKERIRKEESLIILENNKRKIRFSPISSEELNEFSNEIKKKQLQNKNDLKMKKLQLEELWKERKKLLPEHKSKFELMNIKNDNDVKEELLLRKENIRENILEKINFSLDVSKNYKPKLINDKLKRERIEKIKELKGLNRKKGIKDLDNKLKLKTIKLIKSQPQNFKKKNFFKIEDTIAEQQAKKLIKNEKNDENIKKEKEEIINDKNDDLINEVKYWKKLLNNNKDIFNIEENNDDIELKEEKKKYKIKRNKMNKVNSSTGSPDFILNKIKNNDFNNIYKMKEEKQNINDIKTKLNILNEYIGE